ncbi:hypothetical protein GWI33_011132 [Rhynchophorus ferrugineus]|uniref:Uncharacterized protein n=1 Tax=Rhynchophorus ferrugineus TaxID=354439 RepID=A0A834J1Q0_RHYFE|nr:hypothetical protein GWI33_011132 [Rhynchophorus ferrugineus]
MTRVIIPPKLLSTPVRLLVPFPYTPATSAPRDLTPQSLPLIIRSAESIRQLRRPLATVRSRTTPRSFAPPPPSSPAPPSASNGPSNSGHRSQR